MKIEITLTTYHWYIIRHFFQKWFPVPMLMKWIRKRESYRHASYYKERRGWAARPDFIFWIG